MKEAFLRSIREEYPNEEVTRLVFADWCAENKTEIEEKLRRHIPPMDGMIMDPRYGDGYSDIDRDNYGYIGGDGGGYGYSPISLTGLPPFFCYGSGYGCKGSGYKTFKDFYIRMPKLHQNQLIFLPFSFVFCGYVAEQFEPYQFKITNASMVCFNGFDSWEALASGLESGLSNSSSIFADKFGEITIGPQIITSVDWEGDLL